MPDLMFRISDEGTYLSYNAPNPRDLLEDEVVGKTLWTACHATSPTAC